MTAIHRILVPTDFSACSRAALDLACELAPALGATLTLVHATAPRAYPIPAIDGAILPDPETAAEQLSKEAYELNLELQRARARVPAADMVIAEGDPLPVIEQAAKDTGADLIVIGTHGHRGVRHALLGSVAEKLVQRGPCPVLTVRAK
jgi:nucleotide-binding universal stress UspA family protein